MFDPVRPDVRFPQMEEAILQLWKRNRIVEKALAEDPARPRFVFYEGPPTANNKPGLHHVWARVFKDIYCRYKTMRGFYVPRKAGWDCHGLPVELEIEKELGIDSKPEIERYGIDRFNERCRESVQRYVIDWENLTERIGFWLDVDKAYWTMSNEYIESVWWQLGKMWDEGLLYRDAKVVPYCPRCGTALSSHEVAQGYQDIVDPSVYVRFPIEGRVGAALLVWTTTPWTLVSNVAVAAHPDAEYVEVDIDGERLVLAEALLEKTLGERAARARVIERMVGRELRYRYRRPFDYLESDTSPNAYSVVTDEFVTTTEGTGLVHIAPAFGEVDREVGRRYGLDAPNPVDDRGRFDDRVGAHAGKPVREANQALIQELEHRKLLFRAEEYLHSYPHCWRCGTPLIYWSKATWYIETTRYRDRLLEENQKIDWHPEHIRDGRFGDWLANNVDWSLGRDRYWGTPLPIWSCDEGHHVFVRSRKQLEELSGRPLEGLDLHRPYVDEVTFPCPRCPKDSGSSCRRDQAVLDAWFDSGAMPAAQFGYPYAPESKDRFEKNFPADFIAEGIDQTRGWFYSLLAVSTLVFGRSSYKSVLCLGHIVDSEGRKMSKRLGNVIDPWAILDRLGADALRWYFFSSGSPWVSNRVSWDAIEKSTSQFLLTLWNTYSFFVTYANVDGFDPCSPAPPLQERSILDRWIVSRLQSTVVEVTQALDEFDALRGARSLEAFVRDLSNWYVRRNRRRFWSARSEVSEHDKQAAYHTLHTCLSTVAVLVAPYCPFVSEEIYQNLVARRSGVESSVHLQPWPEPAPEARDPGLEERVSLIRKLVSLGRAARTQARIKIRQPLSKALLACPSDASRLEPELVAALVEELNVDSVEWVSLDAIEGERAFSIKPNFKSLGPKLGAMAQKIPAALASHDARPLVESLERLGYFELEVDGRLIRVAEEDVVVEAGSKPGVAVAIEGDYGVALHTSLDDQLRSRGLARELTHRLQNLRKETGLEVSDRVELWIQPDSDGLARAVREHRSEIAAELLAISLEEGSPPERSDVRLLEFDGERARVAIRKAQATES